MVWAQNQTLHNQIPKRGLLCVMDRRDSRIIIREYLHQYYDWVGVFVSVLVPHIYIQQGNLHACPLYSSALVPHGYSFATLCRFNLESEEQLHGLWYATRLLVWSVFRINENSVAHIFYLAYSREPCFNFLSWVVRSTE